MLLLENEGIDSAAAYDGDGALAALDADRGISLIILDIMMPGMDGLSATLRIRRERNIPILLLSAKSEYSDKVLGLSMGADDYVAKPFHPQELMARVKSLLRRYNELGDRNASDSGKTLTNGDLCYDTGTRQLTVSGASVRLTATETKLVELLMRYPGRVFPAEEIYERVWDEAAYGVENTVMVHIRRIREKIEANPKEPKYLKVVWGIGYKIEKF
ncbi:MAG: response regulator transcription factor [Oscillospiraceae bacterium]|nr:response regulator transcription factor [Oscillospiraceae bacterium]